MRWAYSPWFQWFCDSKRCVCTRPYLSLGKTVSGKRRQNKSVLYSLGFNNSSLLPSVSLTVLHTGLSSKQGWGMLHLEQTPYNLVLRSFPWKMWAWPSLGRCLPFPCYCSDRGHCPSVCRACFPKGSTQVPKFEGNDLGWSSSSVGGEQRWPQRSALCTWRPQGLNLAGGRHSKHPLASGFPLTFCLCVHLLRNQTFPMNVCAKEILREPCLPLGRVMHKPDPTASSPSALSQTD